MSPEAINIAPSAHEGSGSSVAIVLGVEPAVGVQGRVRRCLNGCVSWQHRLPHGISGFRQTGQGFEASVSIPADEEGFFGRHCPDCERVFKMRVDQWEALQDDAVVTCAYCGHEPPLIDFFANTA